jgi:hypothetical protein
MIRVTSDNVKSKELAVKVQRQRGLIESKRASKVEIKARNSL